MSSAWRAAVLAGAVAWAVGCHRVSARPSARTKGTSVAENSGGSGAKGVEIRAGATGSVGGSRIGITSVHRAPDGSMRVGVAVSVPAPSCRLEATLDLGVGDWLPVADGMHEVTAIAPNEANGRGNVTFSQAATQPEPAEPSGRVAIYLADGQHLRVVGPDRDHSYDLTVTAWQPDAASPRSVAVEWLPARYTREDTDPKDVHDARLEIGGDLKIGGCTLRVAAISGKADHHPAWVRFSAGAFP